MSKRKLPAWLSIPILLCGLAAAFPLVMAAQLQAGKNIGYWIASMEILTPIAVVGIAMMIHLLHEPFHGLKNQREKRPH